MPDGGDKPYKVGKGKPPREHQFKPGNKGGGRKRGSRNRSDFDKLLDEWVTIGEDRLGRPQRKRWRDIVNRQLLKKAGMGDLAAIRIVKEFEHKQEMLRRAAAPGPLLPDEIARAEAEAAEKRALSERLVRVLDAMAAAKRGDTPRMVYQDGKVVPLDPPSSDNAAPGDEAWSDDPGGCAP